MCFTWRLSCHMHRHHPVFSSVAASYHTDYSLGVLLLSMYWYACSAFLMSCVCH